MSDAVEDDLGLEFHPGALRLRFRCRWAGVAVALATLLPYEVIDGHPQFLWDLAGELGAAGLFAYLAPLLAGLLIVGAGLFTRRSTTLALTVLAALVGASLVVKIGADASAWELLPLPDSLSQRLTFPLLALALTAAGANLSFNEHARRVGRDLLIAAFVLAVAFYLWPGRGEAPLSSVTRILGGIPDLPHWRFKLGFAIVAILLLWPAIIASLGLLHAKWPPRDPHPVIALTALYGLPLLLAMLVFRALPGAPEGWDVFMTLGGIVVLAGIVALLSSAIEVAAEDLLAPHPERHHAPGFSPRKVALIAVAALALVVGVQTVLAMPPAKGVEWTLKAPTPEADRVFGRLLPTWNRERLWWDRQAREASGATAHLQVKKAARELIDAARELDPKLGDAMKALTRGARDLHVSGRSWLRLMADVNAAIRAAGLPYYLDPTVFTFNADGEQRRHFRMRSYRVEKVRRYRVDGDDFATLHVDRIDRLSGGSPLLGFSRDRQPFAIVSLAESRHFEDALLEGALANPPSCDEMRRLDAAEGLAECGKLLAKVTMDLPGSVEQAIADLTDRHELQHQVDGPHLQMSGAVLRHLQRRGPKFKEKVNRELSAYVAELTAPGSPAHLGLVHLARFAFNGDERYDVFHVAVIAFEAMTDGDLLDADGEVDRSAVLHAFVELSSLSDAELRERAREAWEDLYGEDFPDIELVEESVVPVGG